MVLKDETIVHGLKNKNNFNSTNTTQFVQILKNKFSQFRRKKGRKTISLNSHHHHQHVNNNNNNTETTTIANQIQPFFLPFIIIMN